MDLLTSDLEYFRSYVYREAGIVLDKHKNYLIQQRIEPILKEFKFRTFTDLCISLRSGNLPLKNKVITEITTHETSFFRDFHPFDFLKREIFPELVEKKRNGKIGIWCAASSTGQEVFTMAMCVMEFCKTKASVKPTQFEIFASDISDEVVKKAKSGVFSKLEINRGLPPNLLKEYFEDCGDSYKAKDILRSFLSFRVVNLTRNLSFVGTFDLILCRNVLMYFDNKTKEGIIKQMGYQLHPEGYLMLGSSENLYGLEHNFQTRQSGETIIYQKKSNS